MAALLVEAARADHHVKEEELEELGTLLAVRLDIDPEAATGSCSRAREAVEKSVSLYEFTRPLHEAFTYEQKEEFVRMLWHVALADRHLDKYEDYLDREGVGAVIRVARRRAAVEARGAAVQDWPRPAATETTTRRRRCA